MQFTTLLALAPLALAAPLATRQSDYTDFTVLVSHSGSPIHLTSWVIRDHGIFLSGQSGSYCPEGGNVPCENYSNTSAFVATAGTNVPVSLEAAVAGGQQLFASANGALDYTIAHSGQIPDGADTTGFTFQAPESEHGQGYLGYAANGATGFVACQGDDGAYQVFANVEGYDFSNCIGMSALAYNYPGTSAFQFD